MKTNRLTHLIAGCVAVLALSGAVATAASALAAPQIASQTEPGDPLDPRTYDPDSRAFLTLHATGVQRYACQANGSWLFSDPVADLYAQNSPRNSIGSHYLNFATGRPVWEFKDGSTVEAARKATASGGAGNIAALLLQAVVTTAGDDGDRFVKTTWVQRLNPSGGVAPDGTCTPGATIAVPYSTDYVFWASKAAGEEVSDD
jgi:Protein of unknown function (DUF3455)